MEKIDDCENVSKALEASDSEKTISSACATDYNRGEQFSDGLWAWVTVFGTWIIQFSGFGYTNAFGVYQDFYVREFLPNSSSSQISWIGSVQSFLIMSSGVVTGPLFDKGYFRPLMWTGSFLVVFSLFMLSLAKPGDYYQVFLAQGIGLGLGSGLTYVPSVAVLAQHFPDPHKRAFAMTLVASGSSLGGVVHPIMLNNFFHGQSGSFATGVRASAGLLTGLLLIVLPFMRTKYPVREKLEKTSAESKKAVLRYLRDPVYVACIFGMICVESAVFFPLFYIQLDAVQRGLNTTFSFYSLTMLNVASVFGRVVPGLLTRNLGVINLVIAAAIGCASMIFALFGVMTVGGVVVFCTLFGFFSGGLVSLLPPMLALQADSPAEIGSRIGVAFFFVGIGVLISTPIDGALLTKERFLWWRPILFSGVMCVAGALFLMFARYSLGQRRKSGWKL